MKIDQENPNGCDNSVLGVWSDPASHHPGDSRRQAEADHGGGEGHLHRAVIWRDLAQPQQGQGEEAAEDGHGVYPGGQ